MQSKCGVMRRGRTRNERSMRSDRWRRECGIKRRSEPWKGLHKSTKCPLLVTWRRKSERTSRQNTAAALQCG